MSTGPRIVIAGLGSEYRRDDGAGVAVARALADRLGPGSDIGPVGEPLDLLGRWDGAELAVLVDTVRSADPPGTIQVVELGTAAPTGPAPAAGSPRSSHGIGLVGVLRLARAIGTAPRRVVLVGIVGSEFGAGEGLSPAVRRAVTEAVDLVAGLPEIEAVRCA